MGVLGILLLVFFVIIAVLLILLVLVQNEEGDSLGGIFAGGSGSAFGSRSGNVLTRGTSLLGALFLIISLGLALVNRSPGDSGVEAAGRQAASGANKEWWLEDTSSGAVTPEVIAPESAAPDIVTPEAATPESVAPIIETEAPAPEAAAPITRTEAPTPEAAAPITRTEAPTPETAAPGAGADETAVPEAEPVSE